MTNGQAQDMQSTTNGNVPHRTDVERTSNELIPHNTEPKGSIPDKLYE